MAKLTVKL